MPENIKIFLGIKSLNKKHNFLIRLKIKQKTYQLYTIREKFFIASKGRYEYRQINDFMISIKGEIRKIVLSTYMKCYNLPMLCRKFFLNKSINKDFIINHCTRPLHKFERILRECYLNENPTDNEMRAIDNNLNNYYILFG